MTSISLYGHVHISSAFDFRVLILLSVVHNIIYAIFSYKKIFTPIRKTKEKFIFIYGERKKKKQKNLTPSMKHKCVSGVGCGCETWQFLKK